MSEMCYCMCVLLVLFRSFFRADIILYSIIALIARIWQALRPVPGHPWYRVWHNDSYVELPSCDIDGFRLNSDSPTAVAAATAAAAADKHKGSSSSRPSLEHRPHTSQHSVFARHGWNIPTITAMAGSMAGASSHSTLGSSSARSLGTTSFNSTTECSNSSNASGSAAATPLARRSMLQHGHHLDTIFSIDIDDLQQQLGASEQLQEPVYQLDTQVGTVTF